MFAQRQPVPAITQLEDRVVPTINILFDFRFDDLGFFTNHADRIQTIKAAAADVGARFSDALAAIPFPAIPGDSWKAQFNHPSALTDEEVANLLVPANTIVVFVGARELLPGQFVLTSSHREVLGSSDWNDLVLGRGQATSFGPQATDFSPWGGSISYDLLANWHFGIDPPGGSTEFDLYTATEKALFHLLGFGMSEAWKPRWKNQDGFGRGQYLYNLAGATRIPAPFVLLVEGPPDVFRAVEAGLPAVATLGIDVSEPQLTKLVALGRRVVVAFDNDERGRARAPLVAGKLQDRSVEVEVRHPPDPYKDIGEMSVEEVVAWLPDLVAQKDEYADCPY